MSLIIPYTQLKTSSCHGIIKALGGDILVESQLGKGTKMTLAFPVNLESNEAVAQVF